MFSWAPKHVGIKGHEAADETAEKAFNTLNSPVSYSDMKLAKTEKMAKRMGLTIWQ